MFKKSFLRNAVKTVAVLAVFSLFANSALAQETVSFTDASGVTCTYTSHGTFQECYLTRVTNLPASVTKWVIPEQITFPGGTLPVVDFLYGAWDDLPINGNNTLTEIVFPKFMESYDPGSQTQFGTSSTRITNLHKLTFGEQFLRATGTNGFAGQPLETVTFKSEYVITGGSQPGQYNFSYTFENCPATTKIIVPCGTKQIFVDNFNTPNSAGYNRWQDDHITWTAANFEEAPCLNTLTVLSSNTELGNAISQNGSSQTLTTTTPDNTSAEFSGTATLYALAKGGKLFVGWSDGNLDNPRTVSVSSDTTFTASFATCEGSGIAEAQAASPLRVYPNPANTTLNVELENNVTGGTLALFDLNGKAVLSQAISGSSAQISLSALSAGNYILRLVENGTASAGVQVVKK
jgi:hypothetical protein